MSPPSDSIDPSLPSLHQTSTNITLSPELFEKLYLTPKVPHVGDAYKRFANPTPMGFVGFVISTFSFAMVMMGWGGAAGLSGVAGIFFFVGPVLLLLGTIFEWVMGNFFPVSTHVFLIFSGQTVQRRWQICQPSTLESLGVAATICSLSVNWNNLVCARYGPRRAVQNYYECMRKSTDLI